MEILRNFLLSSFCFIFSFFMLQGGFAFAQSADLVKEANNFFKPLPGAMPFPPDNAPSEIKVKLGKMLFFEPRLSKSAVISCNSCHNLATGGVDNLPTSIGHLGQFGPRNSPTVLNAGLQLAQFWDGRAASLEDQAKGPILNPMEMAMPNEELVLSRLRTIPEYVELFKKAFPEDKNSLSYDNIARAIAAFERTLLTPSPFDEFLKGKADALSSRQQQGLKLVIQKGCIACHNGVGAGGGLYQKFGIKDRYEYSDDQGRYNVTKKETDRLFFKVPLWRNVTRTAPYFHDGSIWDLKEAIRIMGRIQLGTKLSDDEVDLIAEFLHSLEGKIPDEALMLPVLPSSTLATPKPVFK
ncbi:MAG TPA: cytochrome-c peroxidase [Nitrospiria bacterium]|nr:cytochrome-c peroxidase [Nitrospiria bacterium]